MISVRSSERGAKRMWKRSGKGRVKRTTLLRKGSHYGSAVGQGISVLLLLIDILLSLWLLRRRATEIAYVPPVPGAGSHAAPPEEVATPVARNPPLEGHSEEEGLLSHPLNPEAAQQRNEPPPGEERPEHAG